jgi:Tfp pilus assembly protein PilV
MRGELNRPTRLHAPGKMCDDKSPRPENVTGSKCGTAGGRGPTRKKLAGFTLTEVVIASTLLILAMVPILRALTGAIASSTIIERRTQSLVLAQGKLDDIRARSIYNYNQDFTTSDLSVDGAYLCNVADSTQTSDLRRISVSVGYDKNGSNSLESSEIEVRLSTLLARRW